MPRMCWIMGLACAVITCGGCGALDADEGFDSIGEEIDPRIAINASETGPAGPTESRGAEGEPLGEAHEALGARDFCIAAVLVGAGLGCVAATSACTGTTVVTLGGTAYPCTLVLAGACVASPLAAQAYAMTLCT